MPSRPKRCAASTVPSRDRSSLPQKALVVFQAALSLVLLAGAILMTKSLEQSRSTRNSASPPPIATCSISIPPARATPLTVLPALYRQIEDRFAALPGVANVGLALYSPLEGDNWGECVIQQGHPAPRPATSAAPHGIASAPASSIPSACPSSAAAASRSRTRPRRPRSSIVNQTFVKRFFPNQDPIGQHFGIDLPQYSGSLEIVGVFADFKMNNPRDEVRPVYLRPLTQPFPGYKDPDMNSGETQSMFMNAMVLDFNAPPSNVNALIRRTLAGIDPNLTVMDLRSFDAQVAGNFNQERLVAQLTSLFGILALILASVGLYGVMSYFVARRTSEIGIRMALGATRSSVVAMVMRGALWQILIGLVLGIPASLYAGYLMNSLLYNVAATIPWPWPARLRAPLCAAAAGFIPARRAASIEPMQALRTE